MTQLVVALFIVQSLNIFVSLTSGKAVTHPPHNLFRHVSSGKCLTIPGGPVAPGIGLILSDCPSKGTVDATNKLYHLHWGSVGFQLKSAAKNSNICLRGQKKWQQMITTECESDDAKQQILLLLVSASTNELQLRESQSPDCFKPASNSNGAQIILSSCGDIDHYHRDELWKMCYIDGNCN